MIPMMFWFGYTKPNISNLWFESVTKIFVGLFATALLIIPIRGGFQLIPMNQSSVYFSNIRSINQATENPIWVLFQSILEEGDAKNLENIHIKFKTESADSLYNELYPQKTERTNYLISCPKPNVVIIVWESLTAKVSSGFGGKLSCTPNLDNIGREGIKFTNFYATGDRSDKGLAAILSSVPAIGKKSIMADPIKVSRLPFLVQDMKRAGYKTSYIYGGELEFANMKNFMIESGFQRIIGKDDFPTKALNSKWGAHDEIVFDKQIELANAEKEPFFHTLFTLSSHEPFEFPGQKRKESEPVDSLFCHAHKYTDGCVGRWFEKVKKTAWWKNTLVIIVLS
jgi:phosphoglycerol transferase MdoB-like AlkP superfamily enzyme